MNNDINLDTSLICLYVPPIRYNKTGNETKRMIEVRTSIDPVSFSYVLYLAANITAMTPVGSVINAKPSFLKGGLTINTDDTAQNNAGRNHCFRNEPKRTSRFRLTLCAATDRPPVNSARPPVIPPIKLREFTEFLVGSAPRSQGLWRSQV